MLIFIDLRDNFLKPFVFNKSQILTEGIYALGFSLLQSLEKQSSKLSLLVNYTVLQDEIEDFGMTLFKVESICGPCIAIPIEKDDSYQCKSWMFLKARNEWNKVFCAQMKKQIHLGKK